jgi:hypothetical protein
MKNKFYWNNINQIHRLVDTDIVIEDPKTVKKFRDMDAVQERIQNKASRDKLLSRRKRFNQSQSLLN